MRKATVSPMMLVETRVGSSAIHGMGLFAKNSLPKGTPIWRFEPGFDQVFSAKAIAELPSVAQDHARHFSFISKADGFSILSGDHACFINHSDSPNTGAPTESTPAVTTVALRDIAAGEEITCNYFSFDADAPRKLGTRSPAQQPGTII